MKDRTLFDIWADMSYALFQWEKEVVSNTEFSKTLECLLRELKREAEDERVHTA